MLPAELLMLECLSAMHCASKLGWYQDSLSPQSRKKCLGMVISMLSTSQDSRFNKHHIYVVELVWHLLAHKRFALEFVRASGADLLLKLVQDLPVESILQGCVALCFERLAMLSGVMEYICQEAATTAAGDAATAGLPERMVAHCLDLLKSPREMHRRYGAAFFVTALAYPQLLNCFDKNNTGLAALLNVLSCPTRGLKNRVQSLQASASPSSSPSSSSSSSSSLSS